MEETQEIKILLVKDLQKELRIGRDKAYALMRTGGFPSIQIGKTFFVTDKALDEWLKNNEGRKILI